MHVNAIVQGLVQGVGYRYFVIVKADDLGLTGYVRNLPDGTVEVVAEGDKGLLNDLVKELKIGPIGAEVTAVEVKWTEKEDGYHKFSLEH